METMDAIQAAFASKFDLPEVVRNDCESCPGGRVALYLELFAW